MYIKYYGWNWIDEIGGAAIQTLQLTDPYKTRPVIHCSYCVMMVPLASYADAAKD